MKRQKKQFIQWLCTILSVLFLAGCGGEMQNIQEESTAGTVVYGITENAILDPDKSLKGELKEGGWIRELAVHLENGVVYRLAQLWEKVDGMDLTQGYYIQILEAPYEQWVNHEIRSAYWDKEIEYEGYSVMDICGVNGGDVYYPILQMHREFTYPTAFFKLSFQCFIRVGNGIFRDSVHNRIFRTLFL